MSLSRLWAAAMATSRSCSHEASGLSFLTDFAVDRAAPFPHLACQPNTSTILHGYISWGHAVGHIRPESTLCVQLGANSPVISVCLLRTHSQRHRFSAGILCLHNLCLCSGLSGAVRSYHVPFTSCRTMSCLLPPGFFAMYPFTQVDSDLSLAPVLKSTSSPNPSSVGHEVSADWETC